MIVKEYTLTKKVGSGSFGECWLATKDGDTEQYCIKKMPKSQVLKPKAKIYFNNEIHILSQVEHPNIVRYFGLEQNQTHFFLIFEYCNGGSLNSCLEKYMDKYQRPFTQEIVQHIMKQILDGIHYLHSNKILHRDIKLDNILVKFKTDRDKENLNLLNATVTIIDFGFARYIQSGVYARTVLGSPMNADPKIIQKMARVEDRNQNSFGYDQKADIWSTGTICYEMLVGQPPFDAEDMNDLVRKIQKGEYKIPTNLQLSKEAISFINCMMQDIEEKRMEASELLNHYFLTKNPKDFTKVDLKGLGKNLDRNKIIMNIKDNPTIWSPFANDEAKDDNDMFDPEAASKIRTIKNKGIKGEVKDVLGDEEKTYMESNVNSNAKVNNFMNDDLYGFLSKSFDDMNKNCLEIKPMLLPFIPGGEAFAMGPEDEFTDELLGK